MMYILNTGTLWTTKKQMRNVNLAKIHLNIIDLIQMEESPGTYHWQGFLSCICLKKFKL